MTLSLVFTWDSVVMFFCFSFPPSAILVHMVFQMRSAFASPFPVMLPLYFSLALSNFSSVLIPSFIFTLCVSPSIKIFTKKYQLKHPEIKKV